MMQCQLCNDLDGPWEYAEIIEDGKLKIKLICEDCSKKIKKQARKNKKMKPWKFEQ